MHEKSEVMEDGEMSLIDVLLFIKSSLSNIWRSVAFTLLIGVAYYFHNADIYEATANIQMALVSGNAVESPTILLEKVKLPLYFSQATWNSCGANDETTPSNRIADKIKFTLNKTAPFINLTVRANSTQEAINCLNAAITEIRQKQAEIAIPILEQKKIQLKQLNEKLKFAEETSKIFSPIKFSESFPDSQFASRALVLSTTIANSREIKDLRGAIYDLQVSLLEPQTKPTYLTVPIYAPEVAVNKRPVLTLILFFALGIFVGSAVTCIQRVVPAFGKKLRDAHSINSQKNKIIA